MNPVCKLCGRDDIGCLVRLKLAPNVRLACGPPTLWKLTRVTSKWPIIEFAKEPNDPDAWYLCDVCIACIVGIYGVIRYEESESGRMRSVRYE